jgi:hypothetical protein
VDRICAAQHHGAQERAEPPVQSSLQGPMSDVCFFLFCFFGAVVGFEPRSLIFLGRCSTTQATPQFFRFIFQIGSPTSAWSSLGL